MPNNQEDRTANQQFQELCEKNDALKLRIENLKKCISEFLDIIDKIEMRESTRMLVNYLVDKVLKQYKVF